MSGIGKSVTVLMSAYNSASYISHSINSILNQTYKNFELLIIDDGSTDSTEEIVNKLSDSRIVYKKILHRGLAGALNYGINVATFDWIARIDADDLNTADRLEKQINFIKINPDITILSSWSVYFQNSGKIVYFLKTPTEHNDIYKFLDLHNPFNHSGIFFNKKLIADRYNEELTIYEDFEFFYRIRNKVKFHIQPEFLVYTRIHGESLTRRNDKKIIFEMLYPHALKRFTTSANKSEYKYWNNILGWTYFFYGDKRKSRKYFIKTTSIKKIIALIITYLPNNYFISLIRYNIKYRLISFFMHKKKYKRELIDLLR